MLLKLTVVYRLLLLTPTLLLRILTRGASRVNELVDEVRWESQKDVSIFYISMEDALVVELL